MRVFSFTRSVSSALSDFLLFLRLSPKVNSPKKTEKATEIMLIITAIGIDIPPFIINNGTLPTTA